MIEGRFSRGQLAKMIIPRFVGAIVVFGAMFFLPAGTFNYWEAWVYSAVILVPAVFLIRYFVRHDPSLLERRTRMQEREPRQRLIMALAVVAFLLEFLLPGFDRRFGWSEVPGGIVIAADVVVALGYLLVFLVYRENTYTSRVIEVEKGQKVISTGPYSVIRHPMYAGALPMLVFTPLALGSTWTLIPAVTFVAVIIARLLNEEQVLARGLPGYAQYKQKVRYRLIPGIW